MYYGSLGDRVVMRMVVVEMEYVREFNIHLKERD